MSVVDYFLNSLVTYLQKKQKARKKRKKTKHGISKTSRKTASSRSVKKRSVPRRRKFPAQKARRGKRPVKTAPRNSALERKKRQALSGGTEKVLKINMPAKIRSGKTKKIIEDVHGTAGGINARKEVCIGEITHFFSQIQVVVLKITKGKLLVGDQVHIKGGSTDFFQKVYSLQIESVDVKAAHPGQLVGLKVSKVAKAGDKVFKPA